MADQLPSWTDGEAKARILEFIRSVTEPGESFVPAPERVAAFDNDGTLWCEKPMYPQADFLLRRWKEMTQAHPGKAKEQPWKAVAEGDEKWLAGMLDHVPELARGLTEAYRAAGNRLRHHAGVQARQGIPDRGPGAAGGRRPRKARPHLGPYRAHAAAGGRER